MRTFRASPAPPPTVSRRDFLTFDVADAMTDRFICTLHMPVSPLFRVSIDEITAFVYQKRPTLKYRKIIIEL